MDLLKPCASSVQEQLTRICGSPQFRESPRLQGFLKFVVSLTIEGRTDAIKESTIAAEVFGGSGMLDDDSIVRSAARRLRTRLEEYYEAAGANDPIYISIPKGSYVPDITERVASDNVQQRVATLARGRLLLWVLALAVIAITIPAVAVLWRHRVIRQQRDPEAQELYLKGRYYWSKRTPEDLNRAVDYFTQAVVKDPREGRAYAGLADTYNLLSEYSTMPYQQAFERAAAAAKTAISFDDNLAEAHNSLAYASFYGAWDAVTAEREFRRALELNANDATAHHWYATFLMSVGREQEALAEIGRAQAVDPTSKSIVADKGLILLWAGHADSAKGLLDEMAAADPQFLSPHSYLAYVYLLQHQYAEHLAEMQRVALLTKNQTVLELVRAGESGLQTGGSAGMLRNMEAASGQQAQEATRYFWLAQLSAVAGDTNGAMQWLQSAFKRHETVMVTLTADPCFAPLRKEAVFREMVKRVGVAEVRE